MEEEAEVEGESAGGFYVQILGHSQALVTFLPLMSHCSLNKSPRPPATQVDLLPETKSFN